MRMLPRRESAMRTGSGIMRLTYRPKVEPLSMDTLRVRRVRLKKRLPSPKKRSGTHAQKLHQIHSTHPG
eukprot:2048741-Heterocapsa_arctica.AAC.1